MKSLPIKTIVISSTVTVVAVAVIVVAVIISKRRKGSTTELPKDTDWGNQLSDAESETVFRIAQALHNDMTGLNWNGHTTAVYTEYAATSDRIFVAVAKYFEERWGRGENLATWLDNEVFGSSLDNTISSILSRLSKYGIDSQN